MNRNLIASICGQSNKDCAFRPDLLKHDRHKQFLFLVGLIIEQYVPGLGNPELKRHAQFAHLSPLDRTISIAVEFEGFEGSKYLQYRKPRPDETITSVNAIKQSSHTEHMDLTSANWPNLLKSL